MEAQSPRGAVSGGRARRGCVPAPPRRCPGRTRSGRVRARSA
ncbi:hypothetical protein EBESD8_25330 [Rhodococcus aetherivorans]|nr:hypothetical protein EBESD8_25330 [Rhodococcus aetherivorans]